MKIIKSSKNIVLIVVSHTDDETIGMGGTIARHLRNGDEIFALSMTMEWDQEVLLIVRKKKQD